MSSIRTETVALDTNEYIIAIRGDPSEPASITLVQERLSNLSLIVPLQVLVELHDNLLDSELDELFPLLNDNRASLDYSPASADLRLRYENHGAKKGDALIAAQLHVAGVKWLISENRHFLNEISDLPFRVITAAEALELLGE